MADKKIHIVWSNGRTIDILLEKNPVADYYYNCVKHLRHVDLKFDQRGNPFYIEHLDHNTVIENLLTDAKQVGLEIDVDRLTDQIYLNQLHSQYFEVAQNIVIDPRWYAIHDVVHLIESFNGNSPTYRNIWFDYMDRAGPLIKPFDRSWLKYTTTEFSKGMCSIREHELGKNLCLYRQHNEPMDINVICRQSPPWVWIKPVLDITVKDYNNYKEFNEEEFNNWFEPFRESWCAHWNAPDWTPQEIFSAIPVGHVEDINQLIECFRNLDYPQRLAL